MIREIFEKEANLIDFVQKNKYQNIYLYIDVLTYGVNAEAIRTFVSETKSEIQGIIYEYYDSLQLMSIGDISESFVVDISEMIIKNRIRRITGPEELVSVVYERLLPLYKITRGYIMRYSGEIGVIADDVTFANADDFAEIAQLICQDSHLGKGYVFENIYRQLLDRYNNDKCENMIIRKDGIIVSHVATYAVLPEMVVVSGMLTAPQYRNQGYGKRLLSSFSSYLAQAGKQPVLYCYEEDYHTWYEKLGYQDIGSSAKLDLI